MSNPDGVEDVPMDVKDNTASGLLFYLIIYFSIILLIISADNAAYQPDNDDSVKQMKHQGAEKLMPPDIDEDAGKPGKTEYRKVDLEKGGEDDKSKDDEKEKKKGCFGMCSGEKKEKKPAIPWMSLVNCFKPNLINKLYFFLLPVSIFHSFG